PIPILNATGRTKGMDASTEPFDIREYLGRPEPTAVTPDDLNLKLLWSTSKVVDRSLTRRFERHLAEFHNNLSAKDAKRLRVMDSPADAEAGRRIEEHERLDHAVGGHAT